MELNFADQPTAIAYWKESYPELAEIQELRDVVENKIINQASIDEIKKFFGALAGVNLKYNAGKPYIQLAEIVKVVRELTSMEFPQFAYHAARLEEVIFHHDIAEAVVKAEYDTLSDLTKFSARLHYLADNKLYWDFTKVYTDAEIDEAYDLIRSTVDERNALLDYAAFNLLASRYVVHLHDGRPFETIQEMFLGIALFLASNEDPKDRMKHVSEFYWVLSTLQLTVATPTLSNARKVYHQLSSCFIDTVPDSLDGIYRSVDNFARISKLGGGMGMYMGKIRSSGSSIRGFEGAAGGVIPWIRVANSTAVAVDQLGMRQGACAVYLDIWHYDIPNFMSLRTNNGDDRMKAHDIFPALSVPDLFWKKVEENIEGEWTLLDPKSVTTHLGINLEDCYGEAWERHYEEACQHPEIRKKTIVIKDLIKMLIKSLVETGTPFIFNRDTVNKFNPNKHKGMIYSSNLCTEIAQNMSPIQEGEYTLDESTGVVTQTTTAGDFVVCNLASLVLPRILTSLDDKVNHENLRKVTRIAIRILDNVIDLNYYPIPYAKKTNREYRSLGLGVSGYHHLLALKQLKWESDEHLAYVDKIFEDINYCAIAASSDLAEERGAYAHFEGSDWHTGAYFDLRDYHDERWGELRATVARQGMRNGYLLAVAPTSSTSIIANTSAGIDPIMKKYFLEEKKSGLLPRVAPDLNPSTTWFYKAAHDIDQNWSIKACAVRQRHIDQAQSMNFYITNNTSMRTVLDYYISAWKHGVKTVYYVRSTALEVEECASCAS